VSCFAVPEILEVGIADGTTRLSFKAGKVPAAQLAAGGGGSEEWLLSSCPNSVLKLWSMPHVPSKGEQPPPAQMARLAGPANASTSLDVCSSSGRTLALCADGTLQVDVFFCDRAPQDPAAGKQAPLGAAVVLSAHEQIRVARFAAGGGAEGRATVVGFGASAAAVWTFRADKVGKRASARTVAPSLVVLASELGGRVLSARAAAGLAKEEAAQQAAASLVVAYGAASNPAFAAARASGAEAGAVNIELLSGSTRRQKLPLGGAAAPGSAAVAAPEAQKAQAAAAATTTEPTVLGPLEAGVARKQPRRQPQDAAGSGDEQPSSRKRARLLPEGGGGKAPSGLSIAPVVRQGLRSKDGSSIEKALQSANRKVIDSTVADLSGPEAFDLLQELSQRLLSQPIKGQVLCTWIQRVLLRHCAFIFSQPVLHHALQPLHDAFQARCSSHRTLVRLRGRLQALRNCGKLAVEKGKRSTLAADASATAPLLEYVEGDEDDAAEDEAGEDATSEGTGCEGGSGDDDDDDDFDFEDSDDDILLE